MNNVQAQSLVEMIQSGHVPHALLLCGPKGSGKREAAYCFATQLLQTTKTVDHHPDIHLHFPEGKMGLHSIESIRRLIENVALAPLIGKWKVFILHAAEKMLPTSGNALLKTLEEPSCQTVIILLADHPERLLPTLVSRCSLFHFFKNQVPAPSSQLCALLTGQWDRKMLQQFDSEEADAIFETIMCWYRDRFLLEIDQSHLYFPHHLEQLKQTPLLSLEEVEQALKLARLAYERSTKLSTCLEIFLTHSNS